MRRVLSILPIIAVMLGINILPYHLASSTNASPASILTGTNNLTVVNPPNTITIQIVQPPTKITNSLLETVRQAGAQYFPAVIALIGVWVALRKIRMGARYTYASEILKLRLRQIQEFYAPALLLIEQSRIVYEKLLWTIKKEDLNYRLDGFRLLDHIDRAKDDPLLKPLINHILDTGKKLTNLITDKSGLIEGGLTSTFIEYQAHFAILDAAREQEPTENQKEGCHEFGYYPRMLNREIREGFKVVLAHLENYAAAGDKTISELLNKDPIEIGKYRRRLLDNLSFYEKNTNDYLEKFDSFDMSALKIPFIEAIENTNDERNKNSLNSMISIMDSGCGTGRDTYEFLKRGYCVTAIDASPAMLRECRRKIREAIVSAENSELKRAAKESEKRSIEATFDELQFRNEFDGIWAAASLLHIPEQLMEENLRRLIQALKPKGVLFMSFKYGKGEYKYDPRYFTCYSRRKIRSLLKSISRTEELRVWLSNSNGKILSPFSQKIAWIKESFYFFNRSLWINILVKKR